MATDFHARAPIDRTAALVTGRAPKDDRLWDGFRAGDHGKLIKKISLLEEKCLALQNENELLLLGIADEQAKKIIARRDKTIAELRGQLLALKDVCKTTESNIKQEIVEQAHARGLFNKDNEMRRLRDINEIYRKELARMGVVVNPLPCELS